MTTLARPLRVSLGSDDSEGAITALLYVRSESCAALLLDLCLIQLGLIDALALSDWRTTSSTLVIASGRDGADHRSDSEERNTLTLLLSPATLECLIRATFDKFERGIDPARNEVECTVPATDNTSIKTVRLILILEPDYRARQVSPASFEPEPQHILALLHRMDDRGLASILREVERMLILLERNDLEEYSDVIGSIAGDVEHVPVLIDMLQAFFSFRGEGRRQNEA